MSLYVQGKGAIQGSEIHTTIAERASNWGHFILDTRDAQPSLLAALVTPADRPKIAFGADNPLDLTLGALSGGICPAETRVLEAHGHAVDVPVGRWLLKARMGGRI